MTVIENPTQFRSIIVSKLCDILEDEKKVKQIETNVFNYAIKESRSKEIIIKWENPMFVHIYLDRLRTICI